MKKFISILWVASAVALSLAGLVGFYVLFVRDMNVFWFILSPIIFALYQFPAVFVYALWKRHRQKIRADKLFPE
jgi:membrane protein YdbS with pleckstrin-like domain